MAPAEHIMSLALSTAIERCLIAKRAENRSPRTVTAYGYALGWSSACAYRLHRGRAGHPLVVFLGRVLDEPE